MKGTGSGTKTGPLGGLFFWAPARCLIEERVDQMRQKLDDSAETRTVLAKAYKKDEAQLREDVLGHLQSGSLFSAQRVVIVWEGAALLRDKAIAQWIQQPSPGAGLWVLAVARTAKDKPPAALKKLPMPLWQDRGPGSAAERHRWLAQRAEKQECQLDKKASALLEELLGESLDPLAAAVDKLCLYRDGGEIRTEDVEALIGRSAGRDFDALYESMRRGSLGQGLGSLERMAREGLRTFDGGRQYGRNATSSTLLALLLNRIRQMVALGAAPGEVRKALIESMKTNPWYADRLAKEAGSLGAPRLSRFLAAATRAEGIQKRCAWISDEELLLFLYAELAKES